jgi:hypothetical protein
LVSIKSFEEKIWKIERIRIMVRAPKRRKIEDYSHDIAECNTSTVGEWLSSRVLPCVAGYQISVITTMGRDADELTLISDIRFG